jgi:hypothetical protein
MTTSGRRRWPPRVTRVCAVGAAPALAFLLFAGGSLASGSQSSAGSRPARVVVAYIAALDRHDGVGVCRLFAPQLRAFEIRWDGLGMNHPSCARTVAAHFRDYYSRHRWASARIIGQPKTIVDSRTGVAAVALTLAHHYVCAKQWTPPQACHPNTYIRPDIVYLIRGRGGWEIIKPGLVYRATELDSPLDSESDYYPPGDASTVNGPANIPPASVTCPASRTDFVSPRHQLQSTFLPNPRGRPGNDPWLKIRTLAASRVSRGTICFTLTLAAAPRPDSAYDISIGAVNQQAAADWFDVEIDGLGDPHPLLAGQGALSTPKLAPYLPRVSLRGDDLEIVAANAMFVRLRRFLIQATTASIQDTEPLLKRPLDAGDLVPWGDCLTFPSGKLDRQGLCGSTPGP